MQLAIHGLSWALLLSLLACSEVERTDPASVTGVNWVEDRVSSTGNASSSSVASSVSSSSSSMRLSSSTGSASSSSSSLLGQTSSSDAPSSSSTSSSSMRVNKVWTYGKTNPLNAILFNTREINSQIWMVEGVRGYTYAAVAAPKDSTMHCWDNGPDNCSQGGYFTWGVAMDLGNASNTSSTSVTTPVTGLCPEYFHVPTVAEFQSLVTYAGGSTLAKNALKALSGNADWDNPAYNSADSLGFGAVGTGVYDATKGSWEMLDGYFSMWLADEVSATEAKVAELHYNNNVFVPIIGQRSKSDAVSLRCIMDY